MEHGSTLGLWLAYGAIGLFLLVLVAVVLRTAMLYGSLVLMTVLGARRSARAPTRAAGDEGAAGAGAAGGGA